MSVSPKFISFPDLRHRLGGVSKMWIRRRVTLRTFPAPIHLGGSRNVFWRVDDIEQWEENSGNHIPPPVNVERVQQ